MIRPWKQVIRTIALAAGLVLTIAMSGIASTPAGAAEKSGKTVLTATVPGTGVILVDSQGHALYTHTDENGKAVECTGECATVWPPLTVSGKKVKAAKGVKALATTGADHQVTSKKLPLYTFSKDTEAGSATGDGVNAFGGTWHVVTVKAKASKSEPTTNAGSGGVAF
jgi:predicted lipoprotein with Yx(FWY)xxD motif